MLHRKEFIKALDALVAEKGIDAASVGLNPDGTVKDGDFEEFE